MLLKSISEIFKKEIKSLIQACIILRMCHKIVTKLSQANWYNTNIVQEIS